MKNLIKQGKFSTTMTHHRINSAEASRMFLPLLVFIMLFIQSVNAQTFVTYGTVEDETGHFIHNAVVKNGDIVTLTDESGKFEISSRKNDIITVTKQGYRQHRVKASSALRVILQTNVPNREVSLLYETLKFSEITGSVSTLNSKSLSNNSVLAFSNALYGKLPGLNLRQSTGAPGDDYASLLIRGKHSFTGSNAPLVMVDGFERDFNTLSVDEVESVSVLKDAASTVLYGMDAANGILLVTTKRGISGKSTVGLKIETGVNTPTRLPGFYGSYEYAKFYNQAQLNDGKSINQLLYSPEQLEGYRLGQDLVNFPNVDWMNKTIRQFAPTTKYLIDFRGGNKIARYYVNVGIEKNEGQFRNTEHREANESGPVYSTNRNLDRINFRSNVDIDVTDKFAISLDLSGRLEDVNSPTASLTSIFNNLYTFHPNVAPVFVSPGIYGGTNTYRNNPVAFINEQGYKLTHRRYFQSNIGAKYDLSDYINGLSAGFRATFDNFYSQTEGYSKTFAVVDTTGTIFGTNTNLAHTGITDETELRSNNFEFILEYQKKLDNHSIKALTVYHQDEYITGTDFPNRRISVSGQLGYDYKNKYIVNIAAQYGATENFLKGRRFGFFPAISGAWIISNEDIVKQINAISFMKLRASTGKLGNQRVGGTRFGYRTLYNPNGTEMPLGNPFLTWEKAYKTDIAVDLEILNIANINITYFNEFRDDILNSGSSLTPAFLGNTFGYTNYGQIQSNGVEFSASVDKQYLDWGYHIILNATYVNNKITRMKELTREWEYLYRQGHPIGQRFGLIAEGLFQSQSEIDQAPVQTFGMVIPGSIRYKDVNSDGFINSDDYVAIGKDAIVPDLDLGLNFGINYKGFYVDAQFQSAIGRDVNLRDNNEGAMYSVTPLYGDKNVSTFVKNPWTIENAAIADYPSLSIENAANNFQTSTYWLRNGNFLRLRALELGYNIPFNIIQNLKINSANIYVRAMNILTLDHIKYFDPEIMEGYPVMKSYNIGLSLKF